MIQGYYYLHTNGDLIYKRELGDTAADLRESDFVRGFWPCDPEDRAMAWNSLVEALASGADKPRIIELAKKWGCNDEDAGNYATYALDKAVLLSEDGNQKVATRSDFENLQLSPAGFGNTYLEAMAALCKELGYHPAKMWGADFGMLLRKEAPRTQAHRK
jgi:hypothetical protein